MRFATSDKAASDRRQIRGSVRVREDHRKDVARMTQRSDAFATLDLGRRRRLCRPPEQEPEPARATERARRRRLCRPPEQEPEPARATEYARRRRLCRPPEQE